jgi:hypothetical protein
MELHATEWGHYEEMRPISASSDKRKREKNPVYFLAYLSLWTFLCARLPIQAHGLGKSSWQRKNRASDFAFTIARAQTPIRT